MHIYINIYTYKEEHMCPTEDISSSRPLNNTPDTEDIASSLNNATDTEDITSCVER